MSKTVSQDSIPLPDGFKFCVSCLKQLPKIWFKGKLCRKCAPIANRAKRLLDKFGITQSEYDYLLAAQDGKCAICGNEPKKSKFAVDHDHKTGILRGILCQKCNHDLLGGAREKIELLKKAIVYLEQPPAVYVLGVRKAPTPKAKKSQCN